MATLVEGFETGPDGDTLTISNTEVSPQNVYGIFSNDQAHTGSLSAFAEAGKPCPLRLSGATNYLSFWAYISVVAATEGYTTSSLTHNFFTRSGYGTWQFTSGSEIVPNGMLAPGDETFIPEEDVIDRWLHYEVTATSETSATSTVTTEDDVVLLSFASVLASPGSFWEVVTVAAGPTGVGVGWQQFSIWVDDITYTHDEPYLTLIQVVRQYPRDDEHGYSGGRRLYPPPRLGRIIGSQT